MENEFIKSLEIKEEPEIELTSDMEVELTNLKGVEPEGSEVAVTRASFNKDSSLVDYVRWSPNYSSRGGRKISKITIHHMAGPLSVEGCGSVFSKSSSQASTNYGIGIDGRIGQYVPECYRAWSTANYDNDSVAVNIELANSSSGGNWPVSEKTINSCIKLVADICKRNGIKKLNYTGNKSGNLTMHQWFMATACPGPYLKGRFNYIADEVNKILGAGGSSKPVTPSKPSNKLDVDGLFWEKSILVMQTWLGSPYKDGVISGQLKSMARYFPSVQVEWGLNGSVAIKLLQKKIGAYQDGFIGPDTVKALQRYLNKMGFNISVDGYWGAETSKAFQNFLNRWLKL